MELAIDYFQQIGLDIQSEAIDLSSSKNKNNETYILVNILQSINENSIN